MMFVTEVRHRQVGRVGLLSSVVASMICASIGQTVAAAECDLSDVLASSATQHGDQPLANSRPQQIELWATVGVEIEVSSELSFARTPFDPLIDFGELIQQAKLRGVPDLNSIEVINRANGERVPFALGEDFQYGDRGRVEWVITDPSHRLFELTFSVSAARPPRREPGSVPLIGVGDLLRYNSGSRPVALPYLSRLVDLTGDGKPDLVGCWNYAYRPGSPWDGIVCYPRIGDLAEFRFGEMLRVRYAGTAELDGLRHFTSIYMNAEFADLNGDGLIDLLFSPKQGDQLYVFLNSGKRPHPSELPIFVASGAIRRPANAWEACRAVDLDRNGVTDLVIGNYFLRNTNPRGWPIECAEPIQLPILRRACFLDLDADGWQDALGLLEPEKPGPASGSRIGWQRNLGGSHVSFAPPVPLSDIAEDSCSDVAATEDKLLVQCNVYQNVALYERARPEQKVPKLRRISLATSKSAVMALSDQAWPSICDWNADGRLDLLVGGGYGWPRIVLNQSKTKLPAFDEPARILSGQDPIRVLMSYVYPGCDTYQHNMGYPYPEFVDWDSDGLADLMLPNCSNRIFWYRNIGSRERPEFGAQQQLNPDGFEDSEAKRVATGRILMSRWEGETEAGQPFFWRTGAAFADFNGDGLTDLITHDGETRKATLFTQYHEEATRDRSAARQNLRLKKVGPLRLEDGRLIDDSIVGRSQHWTESFRPVDWDGDGRTDLVYSCAGSTTSASIYLLRNVGTKMEPLFAAPRTLCCFGEPIRLTSHGPHPAVGDFDGDGKPDLVACVEWSVYPFFSHAAVEMEARPRYSLTIHTVRAGN